MECLRGRDSGFFRRQPLAQMIVLMDSFLVPPSCLEKGSGERGLPRIPVSIFHIDNHKSGVESGRSVSA